MQHHQLIPTTVYDNFLDDPDKVREWALKLEYAKEPNGRWPGKRTKPLHEITPAFFEMVSRKLFSQFFDLLNEQVRWQVTMCFQLIDNNYGAGWVHSDADLQHITSILYLNPDSDLNSGTSIYREKKSILQYVNQLDNKYYGNLGIGDPKEIEESRKRHNDQFEETIRINNVYNRLISFDSHLFHAAQDFSGYSKEPRLTLVMFTNDLYCTTPPVARVRKIHR